MKPTTHEEFRGGDVYCPAQNGYVTLESCELGCSNYDSELNMCAFSTTGGAGAG